MQRISSNFSAHLLVIAMSIGVTLAVRTALKAEYSQERRRIESEAREKRAGEMAADWNALRFTDLSRPNLTEAFLGKVDWTKLQLTEAQQERLRARLGEVFDYLRNPTVEAYLRLKTNGLQFKFAARPLSARLSPGANLFTMPVAPEDVADAVEVQWTALRTKGPWNEFAPQLPERIPLARYSMGLWLKDSRQQGLRLILAFNMGLSRGTEEESSEEPFLLLSFIAHSNSSADAGPVYLSLYWSETDKNWAAHRLFTDNLLNLEIFF